MWDELVKRWVEERLSEDINRPYRGMKYNLNGRNYYVHEVTPNGIYVGRSITDRTGHVSHSRWPGDRRLGHLPQR